MTHAILDLMPWWAWLVAAVPFAVLAFRWLGFNGAIAVLFAGLGAAVSTKSYQSGAAGERDRQRQADDRARDVIHEKKEDVRAIPNTPAGAAERNQRFDRWVK